MTDRCESLATQETPYVCLSRITLRGKRSRVGVENIELVWTWKRVLCLNTCMSRIPPELEAEMTPAVKAYVLMLHEQVDRLPKRVDELTEQVQKLTPRNSSLPPSTEHPHAKPKRKTAVGKKKKQGGQKDTSGIHET